MGSEPIALDRRMNREEKRAGLEIRSLRSALVLTVFVLLAFAIRLPVWLDPLHQVVGVHTAVTGEVSSNIWNVAWVDYAMRSGISPLFSPALQAPVGINTMWSYPSLVPSIVVSPVTRTLGPIFSFNLLITLAPALSAWAAWFAAGRVTESRAGRIAGGFIFGFSSYVLGQSTAHAHLALVVFPPIVLCTLDSLWRGRRAPLWLGLTLGLASGLQLLTSEEIAFTTVLTVSVVTIILVLVNGVSVVDRKRLASTIVCGAVAAAVALLIAGYPLWFQFAGPQHVSHLIISTGNMTAPGLPLVVPGNLQLLSTSGTADIVTRAWLDAYDRGDYVGLPMFVLGAVTYRVGRSDKRVKWITWSALACLIMSLGIPTQLLRGFPLFDSVIAARIAVFTFGFAGLLVAVTFERAGAWSQPDAKWLAALALVIAAVLPAVPQPSWPADVPQAFVRGDATIPADEVTLVAPYASSDNQVSQLWQATNDFRFPMPEGEGFDAKSSSPNGRETTLFAVMTDMDNGTATFVPIPQRLRVRLLADLCTSRVSSVVVGPAPGYAREVALFTELLARPPRLVSGVALWTEVSACGDAYTAGISGSIS